MNFEQVVATIESHFAAKFSPSNVTYSKGFACVLFDVNRGDSHLRLAFTIKKTLGTYHLTQIVVCSNGDKRTSKQVATAVKSNDDVKTLLIATF